MCSYTCRCFFSIIFSIYFFINNDTATTEIYTLSLHDALPISQFAQRMCVVGRMTAGSPPSRAKDRKSTRLNSSHLGISYAVFCLKKKKNILTTRYNKQIVDHQRPA